MVQTAVVDWQRRKEKGSAQQKAEYGGYIFGDEMRHVIPCRLD